MIERHRLAGGEYEYVEIEDDVLNIANTLYEIDPHLRLRFSEAGGYFVVYWKPADADEGDGYLVLTAQELDWRIVRRIQEIGSKDYDFTQEIERVEAANRKAEQERRHELLGETHERAYFELRKLMGVKSKAFISAEMNLKLTTGSPAETL